MINITKKHVTFMYVHKLELVALEHERILSSGRQSKYSNVTLILSFIFITTRRARHLRRVQKNVLFIYLFI